MPLFAILNPAVIRHCLPWVHSGCDRCKCRRVGGFTKLSHLDGGHIGSELAVVFKPVFGGNHAIDVRRYQVLVLGEQASKFGLNRGSAGHKN